MQSEKKKGFVPKLQFPEFRNAAPWKMRTLADVLIEHGNKSTGAEDVFSVSVHKGLVNQVEHLGRSFSAASTSHYNRVMPGDVVYTKSPTGDFPLGVIKQSKLDFDVIVSPLYGVFSPETSALGALLDAYFESPENAYLYLEPLAQKGAKNTININNKTFLSGSLILPVEEAEQRKIADCLTSLDDLIRLEAEKLDAIKAHKKGLMQQLFPAEGETLPKLRFPEFQAASEWIQMPLSKICNVLQGYGFPVALQGKTVGKYPFCKVSDISRAVAESGGILAEAANYVDEEDLRKLRAKPVPKGATVFAKIGEALRLNRRAYVQRDCLIDNNATALKAIDGAATDYFVYLLSQRIDLNKHCGGAVPSVNKSTLEEIEVIVPDPDEQKRIADCLSSLDDALAVQFRKVETFKIHKKGLMQQLFPVLDEVQE